VDEGKVVVAVADLKPDYVGVMSIVFTFFIVFFNFVLLETYVEYVVSLEDIV
jgi:hypothetical protein